MKPIAVLTGATRGIGYATAKQLHEDHELLLIGRDADRLEQVGAELGARTLALDLADLDSIEPALQALDLPRVDVLLNAAGTLHTGVFETTTNVDFEQAFTINVFAVAAVTRALLPGLIAAKGRVLMVNSGAGKHGSPNAPIYAATKFALNGLSESLRLDLGAKGIQVSTIAPGRTDTDMQRELVASEQGTYTPEAYLSADEVAQAIVHVIRHGGDIDYLSIRPPAFR